MTENFPKKKGRPNIRTEGRDIRVLMLSDTPFGVLNLYTHVSTECSLNCALLFSSCTDVDCEWCTAFEFVY